mmetsp:Transcript_31083/g.29919  ORF Transcript_31083/g.29919 Transcript_31083/m.29919 type:complete len:324 (-) Transcript_31083:34-1005(-)|eukprot:CAMPEP_0197837766 /NCGR_PEP_ID=MMETSP1437-20131217/33248_1 /TAXON_ID=49252 ORGANISM="Eucampia antarctica, Strain CCMP1452" /NCGR_SAMPLE_ID=MMETSP1437 /ASSEMBLY_ACC=CAM_ASM_001096 /LENGTH=323 /DNA_ID=CAMNT_0043445091 /DNA_START=12 /DNA_END=983 /DNA_ORIENTATION=+
MIITSRGVSSKLNNYGYLLGNAVSRGRTNLINGGRRSVQRRWHTDKSNSAAVVTPIIDVAKALSVGSIAGLCGSLTGTGGGFIMIPLMTSGLMKVSQHSAHGTSLFAVAATGIAGALGYGIVDIVELDAAAVVAVCGMVTARFGAIATSKLSSSNLKRYLGILMIFMAPVVHLKSHLEETTKQQQQNTALTIKKEKNANAEDLSMDRFIPIAIIGLGSGFLSGLFGIGGGLIVVPALALCTDMTYHSALGTSLCAMSFPAIVGTYTHFQKGNVAMRIAPPLAMGCFFGAYMGGKFGLLIPDESLRLGFSGVMLTLGIKSFFRM